MDLYASVSAIIELLCYKVSALRQGSRVVASGEEIVRKQSTEAPPSEDAATAMAEYASMMATVAACLDFDSNAVRVLILFSQLQYFFLRKRN